MADIYTFLRNEFPNGSVNLNHSNMVLEDPSNARVVLDSFNLFLRTLINMSGKFVYVGCSYRYGLHPIWPRPNYTIGNPPWYKGWGWYTGNSFFIFTSFTAFFLDSEMVRELKIDGIRVWLTKNGYLKYENQRGI
jgi:hypothetical protein